MHASVLLGNQHYHSMVYQILAYLSTALINTIWAGKKKVSSQALKVIFRDEDLKNWWASISKDIYFSILKALWGRNTPCKAFLIYRQAVIALQFLKVKSGKRKVTVSTSPEHLAGLGYINTTTILPTLNSLGLLVSSSLDNIGSAAKAA